MNKTTRRTRNEPYAFVQATIVIEVLHLARDSLGCGSADAFNAGEVGIVELLAARLALLHRAFKNTADLVLSVFNRDTHLTLYGGTKKSGPLSASVSTMEKLPRCWSKNSDNLADFDFLALIRTGCLSVHNVYTSEFIFLFLTIRGFENIGLMRKAPCWKQFSG